MLPDLDPALSIRLYFSSHFHKLDSTCRFVFPVILHFELLYSGQREIYVSFNKFFTDYVCWVHDRKNEWVAWQGVAIKNFGQVLNSD